MKETWCDPISWNLKILRKRELNKCVYLYDSTRTCHLQICSPRTSRMSFQCASSSSPELFSPKENQPIISLRFMLRLLYTDTIRLTSGSWNSATWNNRYWITTKILVTLYTGRFMMFFMITNIYNKKTKRPTLMELFTATGKLKKFFWQLEMFNVCTTGDTAHSDTIFKFFAHTRQHVDACVPRTWISYRCVPCHPWCTHWTSLVIKKNFFSFPVAVNNSIKVGPSVFLL